MLAIPEAEAMIRMVVLQHAVGLLTGLAVAWIEQRWTWVLLTIVGQGGLLLLRYTCPDWFGRPAPPEQAAEYVFRARQVQADVLAAGWAHRMLER